jgi:hypothetical protein
MGNHFWEKRSSVEVSEASDESHRHDYCVLPSFTETFNLIAPIVEFGEDGLTSKSVAYPQLSLLLKEGANGVPSKILKDLAEEKHYQPPEKPAFRWIHIPVNKMDWAEVKTMLHCWFSACG